MEQKTSTAPDTADKGAILKQLDALVAQGAATAKSVKEIETYGPALKEMGEKYADLEKRLKDTEERAKAAERLLAVNRQLHGKAEEIQESNEAQVFRCREFLDEQQKEAGRRYDLRRIFYHAGTGGQKTNPYGDPSLELKVHEHIHAKAQEYGVDATGGYLVAEEALSDFVELLYANSVLGRAGATILNGLTGSPVTIPTISGGTTHYWVGESEAITDSQATFGEIELTPKKSAALVLMSNEFKYLSNQAAAMMIERDMVEQMRVGEETAFLQGGGSKRPRGIFNEPGILTVSVGAIDELDPVKFLYALALNNSWFGSLAWLYHPRTWRDLYNLQDSYGRPIWSPGKHYGEQALPLEGMVHGIPAFASTVIDIDVSGGGETYIGLLRASDCLLANWGGLRVDKSEHYKFAEDQVAVRTCRMVDSRLRRGESLVLASDVTTT